MAESDQTDAHAITEQLLTDLLKQIERCQRDFVDLSLEEIYANGLSALSSVGDGGPAVLLMPDSDQRLALVLASDSLPFSPELLALDLADLDRNGGLSSQTVQDLVTGGLTELVHKATDGRDSFVEALIENDRIAGVLLLVPASKENIADEQRDLFGRVATSIRLMLRAADRFHSLLQGASIDSVTGLFNQRYFTSRLRAEVSRASRHGHPLGLMHFDLDDFKACNDALGYEAANQLLRQVADLLRSADQVPGSQFSFRRSDVPIRQSGEEFFIILPETPKWGVLTKAERLRKAIETLEPPTGNGDLGQITASIGVAAFPEDASDATSLVEAAIRAMFRAKQAGKNRVEPA